jgi:hypothetical protein
MGRWLVEHKTTSEDISTGSVYFRRLRLDAQIGVYLQAEPGAEGVIYDVLRKPAERPKVGESADAFGARVLAKIRSDPDRYYRRAKVVRLESDREELARDVWQTSRHIIAARRLKQYPRNPDSCFQFQRACDYLPVCTGEVSLDDEALYVTREPHSELWAVGAAGDALTQSSLKTWRACPRRYEHRYVDGRVPRAEDGEALRMGRSIHDALESLFLGKSVDDCLTALDSSDIYEYAKSAAMVAGYVEYWGRPSNVIGTEVEFCVPLRNPDGSASRTFVLRGKIDAIVEAE